MSSGNPFSSSYNPKESGREHSCWGKIKAINERLGIVLTHDEITYICTYLWHCSSADEFYHKMDGMTDEELRKVIDKARLRPGRLTEKELSYLYT